MPLCTRCTTSRTYSTQGTWMHECTCLGPSTVMDVLFPRIRGEDRAIAQLDERPSSAQVCSWEPAGVCKGRGVRGDMNAAGGL